MFNLSNPDPERIKRVLTPPAELPGRFALMRVIYMGQGVGLLILTLYALAFSSDNSLALSSLPWREGLVGALVLLLSTAPWAWRLAQPFEELRALLARGVPVVELPVEPVRQALLVFRLAFRASAVQWVGLTLAFTLLALWQGHSDWDVLAHILCPGLAVALLVPFGLRYTLLVGQGLGITLFLVPDGRLGRLAPIELERAWFHVGAMSTVIGTIFPLILLGLTRSAYTGQLALGLLAAGSVMLAGYMGSLMLRSLSMPSGHLEGRMQEVAEGRLNTQALIMAPDTLGSLSSHFNNMIEGLRQREHIRDIFGRYVTRQVAEEILAGRVQLGGERRVATVLFADIHGFTRLAELLPPEDVVALLNQVLGSMVSCVLDAGGVLDKYIGDAIMVLFGVPISAGSPEADARAAVACAQAMSRRLDAINLERIAAGQEPVELGIGVHTGELVAGNIGIPERMEYTVIGDTVNVSARLESMTRQLQCRILVSGSTAQLLSGVPLRELEPVTVRGRKQPVPVFAVSA